MPFTTRVLPKWFDDAKLGIFIHWGIYSVPAFAPITWELGEVPIDEEWFCNNPYAEWYANSIALKKGPTWEHHKKIWGEDFKYEDFIPLWKAEHYEPSKWVELFKKAGAKYVVLVTKHHDGFSLFPSKYSDFTSTNLGPKQDIVGKLKEALKNSDIELGLYYSSLIDWHFLNTPIRTKADTYLHVPTSEQYAQYVINQLEELISNYEPKLLWNDIGFPKLAEHKLNELFEFYYKMVPQGVVNDRWNGVYSDFRTKEYRHKESLECSKFELCRGLGKSFGYNACEKDEHYIKPDDLIELFVKTVAKGGNLLLNIGPMANGLIPKEQEQRLLALGEFLEVNKEGIYGTNAGPASYEKDELRYYFTQKENTLYAFVAGISKSPSLVVLPHDMQPVNETCIKTDLGFLIENPSSNIVLFKTKEKEKV